MFKAEPKVPVELMAASLPKPAGKRTSYIFTTGERLHLFAVVDTNLSGAWHRITTADGKQHVIDPAKVLYIINEVVS